MTYTVNNGTVTIAADGTATYNGAPPAMIGDQYVWYPPVAPEAPLDGQEKPNVRSSNFGDGYVARMPNGLNHIAKGHSLTFGNLRTAQRDAILAFLRERGGYQPFWYQMPGDALRRWVATDWRPVVKTVEFHTVTVSIERDNSPTGFA